MENTDRQLNDILVNILVNTNTNNNNSIEDSDFKLEERTVTTEEGLEGIHLTSEERLQL